MRAPVRPRSLSLLHLDDPRLPAGGCRLEFAARDAVCEVRHVGVHGELLPLSHHDLYDPDLVVLEDHLRRLRRNLQYVLGQIVLRNLTATCVILRCSLALYRSVLPSFPSISTTGVRHPNPKIERVRRLWLKESSDIEECCPDGSRDASEIVRYFDECVERYGKRQKEGLPEESRTILEALNVQGVAGKSLLEIGFGVGGLTFELLRLGSFESTGSGPVSGNGCECEGYGVSDGILCEEHLRGWGRRGGGTCLAT